jgi:hypothetical protein
VNTQSSTGPHDFTIRALASTLDPRDDAVIRRLARGSGCSEAFAPGGQHDPEAVRCSWAMALDRDGEPVAAAWAKPPAGEGELPCLALAGWNAAGTSELALLLRSAHDSARRSGQERLSLFLPAERRDVRELLEEAGFRVRSSISYGGVAEVTVDVVAADGPA